MHLLPRQADPSTMAPPGVVPNYIDPPTLAGRIIISCPLLAAISLIFVVKRIIVKTLVVKRFTWDDAFIILAQALAIARTAVGVWTATDWQWGRHNWDLNPATFIKVGNMSKNGLFIADMLYFVGMMFTKLAILMLYVHVFNVHKRFVRICYGVMFVVVAYLMTFFFIWAFNCNPVAKGWNRVGWTGPEGTCINIVQSNFAVGALNIFTDVVIMILPLPMLNQLQLSKARKLGLFLIFLTSIFVVVCSITRTVIVVMVYKDFDQNRVTIDPFIWMHAELCIGIACACLPFLASLYTRKAMDSLIPTSLRQKLRSFTSSGLSSGDKSAQVGNSGFGSDFSGKGFSDKDSRVSEDLEEKQPGIYKTSHFEVQTSRSIA